MKNHYDHMIKHLGHAWDKSIKAQNSNHVEGEYDSLDDEESPGP